MSITCCLVFFGRSGRPATTVGSRMTQTVSATLDAMSPVELGLDAGRSRTQRPRSGSKFWEQLKCKVNTLVWHNWSQMLLMLLLCFQISWLLQTLRRFIFSGWFLRTYMPSMHTPSSHSRTDVRWPTLSTLLTLLMNWGAPTYSTCNQLSQRGSKMNRPKPGCVSVRCNWRTWPASMAHMEMHLAPERLLYKSPPRLNRKILHLQFPTI